MILKMVKINQKLRRKYFLTHNPTSKKLKIHVPHVYIYSKMKKCIYIYIHIASVTLLVSNLQVLQLSNAQGRSISFARVPFSYGKVNFIFSSTNFPAGKTRKQRFRNRNPAFSPSKTGRKLEVKITCSPRCFPHFFRPKVGKNLHIFFFSPFVPPEWALLRA